jgi:hypothetical protein
MRTQVISALIVFVPTVAFAGCNPSILSRGDRALRSTLR